VRISYSFDSLAQKLANIIQTVGLNTAQWSGTNVATPNVAGVPLVDTHYHRGSVENALISGRRDVNAQVVGDKTGYSLTAGSYSTRASSTQRGTVTIAAADLTATAAISSVTTTRAHETYSGQLTSADAGEHLVQARMDLTNATTITATRWVQSGVNAITVGFTVPEYF
jgi:hypothetical protein